MFGLARKAAGKIKGKMKGTNAQEASARFYSLDFTQVKTYLLAFLFVAGNVVLPQLCHLMPQGGMIWLPIYFFTLIGAYQFGWKVGLLVAVASPVANSLLFGMPDPALLPVILVKSSLLAFAAAFAAKRYRKVTVPVLLLVVLAYQIPGGLFEWAFSGSLDAALQDFRLGVPGMAFQILAGYVLLGLLSGQFNKK